ncbi:MAG: sensor domain-containing diguanylate cyclase [Sulfuritalea sp.]|nr:sensor domain-containing diguanylate cyclase [Sulfuritalea sp.]
MTKTYALLPQPIDEIDNRISREFSVIFLRYAIATLLTGAIAFLMVIRLAAPDQTARAVGPALVLLVAVTAWVLLARGRTQAAVNVVAIGLWIVVTGIAIFNGGVRTPIIIAYPLLIIYTGWRIGLRAALAVAALTGAATLGLLLAESWGFLPKPPHSPPVMHGVVQIIVFILSAILVVVLVRSYRNRLEELGRAGNDLAQRTAELEARRAELYRAQAVAKVGSWVYDLATDTMRLSAETCRIFGLPEGTAGSHDAYLARVHAQDRSAVDHAWREALEGGAAFDHEHRIVVGDSIRWVRQQAELEFAADGTPLRAVGITQDITERKAAQEEINSLAYYDPLTQLPNRRLLHDRIKQALASCSRSGHGGALFFIDLDNFKTLNDTLGHDIGDLLLQQVAQRLGTCVREVDTVARLGGDEFVVLLADLSETPGEADAQARIVGEKVLASLGLPHLLAGHAHRSTASIGITLFGRRQTTVNDLLKQADIAMYQAKAAGRNALSFFEPGVSTPDGSDALQNDLFETDARGQA